MCLLRELAEGTLPCKIKKKKLMPILKKTGIDRRERRLISKLYMDQSVKERLDQEEAIS
jgi:hypothetical protein